MHQYDRIRPFILRLLLMSAFVGATPMSITAQTIAGTFDELSRTAHRDETVYVTDQSGTTAKGRVIEISPTAITLLVKGDSHQWDAADVSRLTHRGRHAGRGALTGVALGAFYGVILAVTDPWDPQRGASGGDMLLVGSFFGGIGAGFGAVIGLAINTEHVLYAAPTGAGRSALPSIEAPDMIGLHARLSF